MCVWFLDGQNKATTAAQENEYANLAVPHG